MANYCVSVKLAACCCDCNYLQRVCNMQFRVLHGRAFYFRWSDYFNAALLYCNGIYIGEIRQGSLGIFPQFKLIVPSSSMLHSIMALFNLYPC